MPFKSRSQARFMFANKPQTAARWASQTRSIKRLPERLAAKRAVKRTGRRKAGR